jgi:hypothetical protein
MYSGLQTRNVIYSIYNNGYNFDNNTAEHQSVYICLYHSTDWNQTTNKEHHSEEEGKNGKIIKTDV